MGKTLLCGQVTNLYQYYKNVTGYGAISGGEAQIQGGVLSCLPYLLGHPCRPPMVYGMNSEGKDQAPRGIGHGIK